MLWLSAQRSTATERPAFVRLLMSTESLYMHILYAHKKSHHDWLVITPVGNPPNPPLTYALAHERAVRHNYVPGSVADP